ncbi:MAG: glycosyltransferase family 61 protein [Rhodospirillaceae bacterium]|nr:MAG: glycosyltransferase family 61 protein [Rhodospirillaceae bacterium]
MTSAPAPGPIPGKELHIVDIKAIGKEVDVATIGQPGTPPIAYAKIHGLPPMALREPVFLNRPEFAAVFPGGEVRRYEPTVCTVQGCFLAGPFGFVVFPDGTLIRQSVLRIEPTIVLYALEHLKEAFPGREAMWSWSSQPVVSLNGFGTDNYFHFLTDTLSQFFLHERIPAMAAARTVLSGFAPSQQARFRFMGEAITRAGLPPERFQPYDGTLLLCQQLIFPVRESGATPWRVAHLRKMMGVTPHPNPRRRLYIARPGGWRRRIPTEPAIRRMLEGYGFEVIDPGSLSFDGQIEAFREARIVVGPHGAAMTNSVFMSPGGMMVELTHEKRVIVAFHEIACMAGLGYACVVGDMLETPGQPSLFSDFTVDVDHVEAAVKAAIAAIG